MIGTSFKELVFIRVCILLLRYYALVLVVAFAISIIVKHHAQWLTVTLSILALAEVAFYALGYLPLSGVFQGPAKYPLLSPGPERQAVFDRGLRQIADPEAFLTKWCQMAPLEEIRRDNVKEFFCWAILNKASWDEEDDEELDVYADKIETLLGRPLEQGRGSAQPIRLTIDPVPMQHRPLLWYAIIALIDTGVYIYLTLSDFTIYRQPLHRLLNVFPLRLHTLLSRQTTQSETLSYFYTPHTSRTHLPVLFVHGIGIGLYPYVRFLKTLHATDPSIGIIALEIPQISARITYGLPSQTALCADIQAILDRHGWDRVVLASHSFGSVVAANMLKSDNLNGRIASMLFSDPVTFLLQLPDVAYNFTRRPPRRANEWQLHYFASMDMLVAHTLGRRFFWAENILWMEDLGRDFTVALSGRDCVADSVAIGRYLSEDGVGNEGTGQGEDEWKHTKWMGKGIETLWFDECDHSQMFETRADFERLVDVLRRYSANGR